MIDIVILVLGLLIVYLVYKINKLETFIDDLYERNEYLEREIRFQDEWVEMDFDIDDV